MAQIGQFIRRVHHTIKLLAENTFSRFMLLSNKLNLNKLFWKIAESLSESLELNF